ncbi:hypothetical protein [Paenibacillus sp. FSL H7-0331]|uniref:hypothetical protein n=1 Tax=Paenibacillus sp. FSL H7-0331 TaxID=1920421 RepID=UPI00096C2DE8|nr:hypothetical protein [Paenibacillus sp. FSL H7-0331]OMF08399.1 hypothetical protein BK127_28760 [Paenibacillus sp. FSL H7-0331]
MKSFLSVFLLAAVLFLIVPFSSVFAYPGGLLDGKPMNITNLSNTTSVPTTIDSTTMLLTDNNESTSVTGGFGRYTWYEFQSDQTISSYKYKDDNSRCSLRFFDANGTQIGTTFTATGDGVQHNISTVKTGVRKVVCVNSTTNIFNEFDVFPGVVGSNPLPQNPSLVAASENAKIVLSWPTVSGATGYNIKRSTTAGGPYTTVASNVYASPYTDTTVTNGTTYYYVVTALNAGGESGNSNEASATPQGTVTPPTGNRALLVITLVSGLEKEYDLSMTEVNSFTTWYAARAAGTGAEVYTINKSFNKASFLTRKDNIAFNKIELYEVNEYTPAP